MQASKDYSHLAFSLEKKDFDRLTRRLTYLNIEQWQDNKSEGESHYFLDPDGHKLELHLGSLKSRLESLKSQAYSGLVWL